MRPEYTTYENQHPVYVSDLITELNNVNEIIIHIKGNIESNLNAIKKYRNMEDVYSRNVNETYTFKDTIDTISFLNCDTNNSLFCVLFNQSLDNDEIRYYPLTTDYN